eukprot:gnl/TRDRNA2_/TRDRNA2_184767_c0_seq1.p2 gnl/TRDRNA2_/TRDRNA2_184767_c0~~gnl/TRDRNA2_/TRDRNA2_184767_c0_seq1.p2  ORF type:complete len:182 (-),score=47.11 gnl/TRDRNA2_/TRDRNA2_184767_c0_seq1:63-608(-)
MVSYKNIKALQAQAAAAKEREARSPENPSGEAAASAAAPSAAQAAPEAKAAAEEVLQAESRDDASTAARSREAPEAPTVKAASGARAAGSRQRYVDLDDEDQSAGRQPALFALGAEEFARLFTDPRLLNMPRSSRSHGDSCDPKVLSRTGGLHDYDCESDASTGSHPSAFMSHSEDESLVA